MKFRIFKLGGSSLDKRSFGFQYSAPIKFLYVRLWFFGIYAALGKFDLAAHYKQITAEEKARRTFMTNYNRKQRRTLMALSRRNAQKT